MTDDGTGLVPQKIVLYGVPEVSGFIPGVYSGGLYRYLICLFRTSGLRTRKPGTDGTQVSQGPGTT